MVKNMNEYGASFCTRTRFSEFLIALCILIVGLALHSIPARVRDIPSIPIRISTTNTVFALDPNFNEKMQEEQVPMWLLVVLVYGLPLLSITLVTFCTTICRHIPHDTRDFFLSFLISTAVSIFVTATIKNLAGAFRPSFYELCGWDTTVLWDGVTNLCTLEAEDNARKSFPSGHSSASFSGLYFLTLYFLGRSRLVSPARYGCYKQGGAIMLKLFLCCIPTLLAAWIAITRTVDNRHHYVDIVAGCAIGIASASIAYAYNYGSVFSEAAGMTLQAYYLKHRENTPTLASQSSIDLSTEEDYMDAITLER